MVCLQVARPLPPSWKGPPAKQRSLGAGPDTGAAYSCMVGLYQPMELFK